MIGHLKKEIFGYIHDRVVKKAISWKEKLLSQADKEILILQIQS